ncbi:hypothetical protein F7725_028526 [Dissostichus mawsoni]|uniref:Uncharacterized protein n=1 Tax=Dissostichus mawsoni TaxID=36200 RepID=A0A7J5XIE4_DISMA|nr:hypothetical protein F7725_028526 [Dissostichus mawsoni]
MYRTSDNSGLIRRFKSCVSECDCRTVESGVQKRLWKVYGQFSFGSGGGGSSSKLAFYHRRRLAQPTSMHTDEAVLMSSTPDVHIEQESFLKVWVPRAHLLPGPPTGQDDVELGELRRVFLGFETQRGDAGGPAVCSGVGGPEEEGSLSKGWGGASTGGGADCRRSAAAVEALDRDPYRRRACRDTEMWSHEGGVSEHGGRSQEGAQAEGGAQLGGGAVVRRGARPGKAAAAAAAADQADSRAGWWWGGKGPPSRAPGNGRPEWWPGTPAFSRFLHLARRF